MVLISELFKISYGNHAYNDINILDVGKTLLISSLGINNGAYGFYNVPESYNDKPIITVPRTGSIGYAFVQIDPCAVNDNCLVMLPKKNLSIEYLFYIATVIRFSKWRFNYGRVITPERLGKLKVVSPEIYKFNTSYDYSFKKLYPKKNNFTPPQVKKNKTKKFQITELFELERGHFHAIDRLEKGNYPTISRVSDDNGLVGFYKKPKRAKIFPKGIITISTVTGDAFFQSTPFIATDNVVMCIPKKSFRATTLFYIQALLNKVKWRYSYGRQCYKGNFQKTVIELPIKSNSEINEDYVEDIVTNQPYWDSFEKYLR
jgi:hypothetical protein